MSVEKSANCLFEPLQVGEFHVANRIAMAPMSRYLCPDGVPHDDVASYYARRATGGVGLIFSEATYIDHPSAPSYEGVPVFHGAALDGWRRVVDAVHEAGGKMFPQFWHTGSFRNSSMKPQPGIPGLGPSANTNAFTNHPEPTKAMTEEDIADVIDAYARAAADAQAIGFDGIEIHGAHGYLIDEFFWNATNRRDDSWGGDLVDRTRFASEIVRAIRAQVGSSFPVSFRFSQWKQQDYTARLAETPAELEALLCPLVDAGVTFLHCSTRRVWEPGFPEQGQMTLAGWTKHVSGVTVIAVGSAGLDRPGLRDAKTAPLDTIVEVFERGEFDILAVGRALIGDPLWAAKLRSGKSASAVGYDKEFLASLS